MTSDRPVGAVRRLVAIATIVGGLIGAAAVADTPGDRDGPTTQVRTEYLMTFVAPLEPSAEIDASLSISNIASSGGWAKGPRIRGSFVAPGGDWLRVMPSGAMRIDVRATLKTDDGALIYVSYNGILKESPANEKKSDHGDVLTADEIEYFMTAPTFETSAPKYSWLNGVQTVGKMVELKEGKGGYVKYDVFILR